MTWYMGTAKTEIHQGLLDMLVLQTVRPEPLHGYAIAQRLRLLSGERLQVPQGSLYPALHRLEYRGLLKGGWHETGGRMLKNYRLTAKGRRHLETELSDWRELSVAIGLVLGTT
jgi:PadR family transcriptional regulator PadR